ncbi:MAG: DNA polymerase I, partial [Candidatus Pacebacteria bacterium CG_4_9_14_0_2_um_filter_36_8]
TTPTGQLINAVYGFSRILLTVIQNLEPTHIAVAFDHPKPTMRHKEFEAYKANRPTMPEELQSQIGIIKSVVEALNIPQFEIEGYEADDLIGTINRTIESLDKELLTVILTGDKDMFQLVDNDTHVYMPGRGKFQTDKEYDIQAVKEKMGVAPDQVPDLKGLMGDSSDNIPGVKGIGPKTAAALIQSFKTVAGVYQALEADQESPIFTPSVKKKLITDKESALVSKELATIITDAPIKFVLEDCRVSSYNKQTIADLFTELNFKSLISLLPQDAFETSVQEALF